MFFLFYFWTGYDSDDDYEEETVRKNTLKDSRWTLKGTYGKVPLDSEDSILDNIYSQKHFSPSLVKGMVGRGHAGGSEGALNLRNSTSPLSSGSTGSGTGSTRLPTSSSSSSGFHSIGSSRYRGDDNNIGQTGTPPLSLDSSLPGSRSMDNVQSRGLTGNHVISGDSQLEEGMVDDPEADRRPNAYMQGARQPGGRNRNTHTRGHLNIQCSKK